MIFELFLFFATIFVLSYMKIRPGNKHGKSLPPGPRQWPIVGNIFQLALLDMQNPGLAFEKLGKIYGDVVSLKLGVHSACVVSSYKAYKEIFTKDEATGRYIFPFATDRSFHKTLGMIWSNGAMWREMRKFTRRGLREFGFGKSKTMDSVIQEEVSDMIAFIKNSVDGKGGVLKVNAHDFAGSIVSILWTFVAGIKFPIGDKTVHEILEHGNRISEITAQNNIYNIFPRLRHWFPKLTQYDKHMESHTEYQEFIKGMIVQAREKRSGREDEEPETFMEVFFDAISKNKDDPDTFYTEEQLIVLLMDLFLAGSETTGTSVTWALLYLVNNPHVQSKLKRELDEKIPPTESIHCQDLLKVPYFKATLLEIFRSAIVAAVPPPRMALNEIEYNGYVIPKGTLLIATVYPICSDKSYWGDPQNFRPERFLDATGTQLINTERVTIFGIGKRICFGESLVWDVMFAYLANFLRAFTFEAIPGEEPRVEDPVVTGTLNPQKFSIRVNCD